MILEWNSAQDNPIFLVRFEIPLQSYENILLIGMLSKVDGSVLWYNMIDKLARGATVSTYNKITNTICYGQAIQNTNYNYLYIDAKTGALGENINFEVLYSYELTTLAAIPV